MKVKALNLSIYIQNRCARSSARFEHRTFNNSIDCNSFKAYIYGYYRKKTADDYWRYATRYYSLLLNRDFSSLKLTSSNKRLHTIYGISELSKFLGIHKIFKDLREAYCLKWTKGNTDKLIINKLLRRKNGEKIEELD
jgi:hypothetical protein